MTDRIPKSAEGVDIRGISKVMDLILEDDNRWDTKLVKRLLLEETTNCILSIKWPEVSYRDKLMWQGLKSRGFSVGSCFALNTSTPMVITDAVWKNLWKMKLYARLKMFLYRALGEVIPTNEIINRKTEKGVSNCAVCGAECETLFHLFKECPGTRALAFACRWGFRLEEWNVNSVREIINYCINPVACQDGLDIESISVFLASLLYYVWSFRNKSIHSGDMEFSKKDFLLNNGVEEFVDKGED